MRAWLIRFSSCARGNTAVEYGLFAAMMAAVLLVMLSAWPHDMWNMMTNAVTNSQ